MQNVFSPPVDPLPVTHRRRKHRHLPSSLEPRSLCTQRCLDLNTAHPPLVHLPEFSVGNGLDCFTGNSPHNGGPQTENPDPPLRFGFVFFCFLRV
ncbi:hypothetical protein TNIN_117861 [Trichonephila inaurata madagascariensis]|uniref:Uncharacterized protein n=1 Tax=Trichonephila inaurata madagascariensis TaxID=2747483 RepID=A0A8X6WN60_9ARAC|nr:hypothetical protein TNIN_117851 [Trichonephila inaurata madagascariensis]GFY38169.1 hypothetical protein TNIN_117861 [Trichonephila inaurata madagascariensis]